MPNRYIREDAIESEPVNALCWHAEVFWRRLLNRVDDFGRYTAHPALLRSSLFPMQIAKVSEEDVARLLAECEEKGLVFTYAVGGKRYLVMNKWEQGRAKESKHPAPPEDICKHMQTYVYTPKHVQTDVGRRKHLQTYVPDSDSDSDSDPDANSDTDALVSGKGRFKPPTREELNLEAAKIGLPDSEVDKFFAYYTSNGWKVGGNKMKSWPHSMVGWAARWREKQNGHANHGRNGNARPHRNDNVADADATRARLAAQAAQPDDRDPDDLPFG